MHSRLSALEQKVGASLPDAYKAFLAQHIALDEVGLYVSSNSDYWGVRSFFELGSGSKDHQIDEIYSLVGDVLPSNSLPVADDWAGNFYLLICSGAQSGSVVWWSHERELNDFSVQEVANSFAAFLELLAYEEI
jgi:hypothetical protein